MVLAIEKHVCHNRLWTLIMKYVIGNQIIIMLVISDIIDAERPFNIRKEEKRRTNIQKKLFFINIFSSTRYQTVLLKRHMISSNLEIMILIVSTFIHSVIGKLPNG